MTPMRVIPKGEFHWVGDGFPVRSMFGYNDLGQELNPFILLDYAAPHTFTPSPTTRGVGEHPHKGFETVTIAYQGEIAHRDSSGGGGVIGAGDVQWMTAGSGLVHEEFHSEEFSKTGGLFEMVQLWVNLPAAHKSTSPRYQTILNSSIPALALPDNAGEVRVIAGEFLTTNGPALTFTPINIWDVSLARGARVSLPVPSEHVKAALVLRGSIESSDAVAASGELAIFSREIDTLSLTTTSDSKLLFLTALPLNEPLVGYGPFVMNTQEEIRAAYNEYKRGVFGSLS